MCLKSMFEYTSKQFAGLRIGINHVIVNSSDDTRVGCRPPRLHL